MTRYQAIKRHVAKLGLCALLALALTSGYIPQALAGDVQVGENEVKLGEEAAAQIKKDFVLVTEGENLTKLREIGNKMAALANTMEIEALYGSSKLTPFNYEFNIIKDDDINAFSVPGGKIYFYEGIFDFFESDHELAAVIAHEIIHAKHHHIVHIIKDQSGMHNAAAAALLAAIIFGADGRDISNIALATQLYQVALVNGYSREAERDADHGAVELMLKTGYNPVGMLTFLERLARKPDLVEMGIFKTHPLDRDRVEATKLKLEEKSVKINRREVTDASVAEIVEETVDGRTIYGINIDDKLIYLFSPVKNMTSRQRAEEVANRVNTVLDAGLKYHELKLNESSATVVARNKALVTVTPADAALMKSTRAMVAEGFVEAIRDILWRQMANQVY